MTLRMKATLILMLLGALVGVLVASWVVPPALAWYSAPGGLPKGAQIQAVVEIDEVIRYATGKLIRWQLIAAALGAAGGLILGVAVSSRSRRRRTEVTPPAGHQPIQS